MKQQFPFYVCLFFLSIFLISCSDDDNDDGCGEKLHTYIESGNKWTYDYTSWFGGQQVYEFEIQEQIKPNMYKVQTFFDGLFSAQGYWSYCGESLSVLEAEDDDPELRVWRKLNSQIGNTWSTTASTNESSYYKTIATDVSVTTPAGTFVCDIITFNIEGAFNVDTIYESSQFGTIKYSGLMQNYELTEKNF